MQQQLPFRSGMSVAPPNCDRKEVPQVDLTRTKKFMLSAMLVLLLAPLAGCHFNHNHRDRRDWDYRRGDYYRYDRYDRYRDYDRYRYDRDRSRW